MQIMVLNDGKTFSNLIGCKIIEIDSGALAVLAMGDSLDPGALEDQGRVLCEYVSEASPTFASTPQ